MEFLPQDVFDLIMELLGITKQNMLRGACRGLYQRVADYRLRKWRFKNLVLRDYQKYIAESFLSFTDQPGKKFFKIIAPPSAGKTILTIYMAFEAIKRFPNEKWLFIIPPKALETWRSELEKFKGKIDPEIEDSEIVVFHDKWMKTHHNRLSGKIDRRNTPEEDPGLLGLIRVNYKPTQKNKIFLCSKASIILDNYLRDKSFTDQITTLVIDEAHIGLPKSGSGRGDSQTLRTIEKFTRNIILMSATDFNITTRELLMKYSIPRNSVINLIPEVTLSYYTVPASKDNKTNFVIPANHLTVYLQERKNYLRVLIDAIKNSKNKLACFIPQGEIFDDVVYSLETYFENSLKIFTCMSSSKNDLTKFGEYKGKCLLLLGTQFTESLNLLVDTLVIIHPDWMSLERYKQCLSRSLRISNENKNVNIINITSDNLGYYRCLYYNAMYKYDRKEADNDTMPAHTLIMMFSLCTALGCPVDKVSPADIIAILNKYEKGIFEWWQKHPHGLSSEHMKLYLSA